MILIEKSDSMLKEKVAVITGGTRGIGYAIAREYLKNHAKVVILGSRKETVERALASLKEENETYEVIGFYPNLTSEKELSSCFEEVEKQFGKIDILINNAGVSSSTPLEKYTEEEIDQIYFLNLKAVVLASKVVVPYLRKSKGVIINTSSMVSFYGQPAGCMYPATKFAVNGLTKSLARELAPYQVRVNAVAPGITNTDMVASLPKEVIEPLIKTIPLGRIGSPQDIASAFVFLGSDSASYITGEILQVDGCARS